MVTAMFKIYARNTSYREGERDPDIRSMPFGEADSQKVRKGKAFITPVGMRSWLYAFEAIMCKKLLSTSMVSDS